MKFILPLFNFLKKLGIIYRLVGVFFAAALVLEAGSDLKFNHEIKKVRSFTLTELRTIDKNKLPRYFGVSDVSAYGDSYVENLSIKYGDTTLSSVIYPVFQNDIDVSKIKETECYVIVIEDDIKRGEIEDYFSKNLFIKGKFDGDVISDESMKILTDSGYKISKDAIVLTKGKSPWGIGDCIILGLAGLIVLIIIVLSFVPNDKLVDIFRDKTIVI